MTCLDGGAGGCATPTGFAALRQTLLGAVAAIIPVVGHSDPVEPMIAMLHASV